MPVLTFPPNLSRDLGELAAALVWCADATRRGHDAGHPELAAWAEEIRALMAYYTGQARKAVAHAQHGQTLVPAGTVGHAKLAVQEMRAWALLGDARMVASMRRRSEQAIAKLPDDVPTGGAFSIRLAEDPPYTAVSLLLLGHFAEAEAVTRRMIATFYGSGQTLARRSSPTPISSTRSPLPDLAGWRKPPPREAWRWRSPV
jgi:hypothetical protein